MVSISSLFNLLGGICQCRIVGFLKFNMLMVLVCSEALVMSSLYKMQYVGGRNLSDDYSKYLVLQVVIR
jgi:hypothetical protein